LKTIIPGLLIFMLNPIALSNAQQMTNNLNYNVVADSTGIHCEPIDFSPEKLPSKKSWQGQWIWLNEGKYPDFQKTATTWVGDQKSAKRYRTLFRKSFVLEQMPQQAVLFVSGDVSFRLYLNDKLVATGPANIGSDYEDSVPPEHWFYSSFSVKDHVRPGENQIAVEVFSRSFALSETTSGQGRLVCDLEFDGAPPAVYTDASWLAHPDTSFDKQDGWLNFDANKELAGWRELDFDETHWEAASVQCPVDTDYLIPSEIPNPMRHSLQPDAIQILTNTVAKELSSIDFAATIFKNDELVFDYTRNKTASVKFSVDANAGDVVLVSPHEKLDHDPNRPFKFTCRNGTNDFETPFLCSFRFLKVKVNSEKGLKINSFQANFCSYPVHYAGEFACSDSFFTKLWDVTRWTTQNCMNDMFYDSPKHQEPIACTGDYLIESMINYYSFGDPWLVRQNLLKTARMLEKKEYDMFHTSYSLLWVQMLNVYFQHTGDDELVNELLPHVHKLLTLFETYLDDRFLLSQAPDYMFMDWISIEKFNAHHPPAVIGMGYLTAFYYKALIDAARLNESAGNCEKQEKYLTLATKIKSNFNANLWDEQNGLYKDGTPFLTNVKPHRWMPADKEIVTWSPHANTLAVLYDLAPKEQHQKLLDYVVTQQKYELQPYFMFYVLDAIQHAGRFEDLGLAFIDKWKNAIDLTTYTLKENWRQETDFGYSGDFSHAWGGSPLYYLSRNVLGVTPESPGYEKIAIRPLVSERLTWAKGKVPVGDSQVVSISWEKMGETGYRYRIEIPEGREAVFYYPEAFIGLVIKINGEPQNEKSKVTDLLAGSYVIECSL
jgi:alpha-L-rhamnosidase